ncbi:MAG: hypothetical protein D6746_05885 [Bacteroidetes bacterium]|nr:MAG: hypothetical protein D6746_05885 [Bacteroidota bacterium]
MSRRFYESFEQARSECPPGSSVAGTVTHSGKPLYFVVRAEDPDSKVRELAFEAREGRPMTALEKTLLRIAEERNAERG